VGRRKPLKLGPCLHLAVDCPPINLAAVFLKSRALSHSAKCPINNLSIQKSASCQTGVTHSPNAPVKSDTSCFKRIIVCFLLSVLHFQDKRVC